MYYETIIHKLKPFNSIIEAATAIKTDQLHSFEIAKVDDILYVSDAHIDDPNFSEIAVLQCMPNGTYLQIESLTNRSDTSIERLAELMDCSSDKGKGYSVCIQIDTVDPQAMANFTCGCCGQWFTGNIKEQLKFGQDNGYGICDDCNNYY